MVSECSHGHEKANDLCYPICRDEYEGVVENCWSKCPEGYKSNGAFCQKPKAFGRGWGAQKQCEDCEKWGIHWYRKCPKGYHAEGCCMCSPDCPHGMADLGLQC